MASRTVLAICVLGLLPAVVLHSALARTHAVVATEFVLLAGVAITAMYDHRTSRMRARDNDRAHRLDELGRRNAALEEAIEGVALYDSTGTFTWASSRFAETLGYEPADMAGLDIRSLLVEETDPRFVEAAVDELRTSGRTEREVRVRRKSGSIAHLHVVLVRRDRTAPGYCFLTDITREKVNDAALRLSEERFRLATLATRDMIADWNIETNNLWVNETAYTAFGYPLDYPMSVDNWVEAVHPDDREKMLTSLNAVFADRCMFTTSEYRLRRYNGEYAHVVDHTHILRDAEGLPLRLVSAITDITARREAEQQLERLMVQNRLILESVADGLYGVDAFGRVTFVNRAASEILGWSEEDLLGRALHDAIHPTDLDGRPAEWPECSVARSLRGGESVQGKAIYRRKNGEKIAVEVSSRPTRGAGGEIVGAVLTFRDITQKLAVQRMKDEFISVVSHELRTPLTSIRGALGLMAGGRVGEVPEPMRRMVGIAASNTERLVRLVNDMLDLERIDAGKMVLERRLCDAESLLLEAVEGMKPLADQSGVRIDTLPSAGTVSADPGRILQTLTNLIGNAIKFSPPGSVVSVAAEENEGDVRFSIVDQGRGIPADKLQSIFERFQQVDASDSRQKGGTGLGLAICRNIVRHHGGEIWAENGAEGGSRFVFTLPRRQAAAEQPATFAGEMTHVA